MQMAESNTREQPGDRGCSSWMFLAVSAADEAALLAHIDGVILSLSAYSGSPPLCYTHGSYSQRDGSAGGLHCARERLFDLNDWTQVLF